MKTVAYLRVSRDTQDVAHQRLEILEYARTHRMTVDEFIEIEISSRMDQVKRTEVMDMLESGDTLIVSELSRLGRSTGEVINLVDTMINKKIRFIAIKQNWIVNGENDTTTQIMKAVLSLLAELERDLISQRTKQALAAKKASGVKLGRPVGSLGISKLDKHKPEIQELLKDRASKSFIARRLKVSRTTLIGYMKTRNIGKE
jgi:DNA invertase Pin-like site-specific DNA recombinase